MRKDSSRPRQEGPVGIILSYDELQFVYQLLTQLKGDDLISEGSRRRAIEWIEPMWLLARDVTKSQSTTSVTERSSQDE